jgi:hypothetical protein
VAQKTGTIIRASVGAMFGDGSTALNRAPGADFPTGIGPSLDNITYRAQQTAYAVDVPDEQVRDSHDRRVAVQARRGRAAHRHRARAERAEPVRHDGQLVARAST